MPAKSQQQLKFIYAIRNKYKTKKEAPKKFKWVFDEEWTDVKMKELPKVTEGMFSFMKKPDLDKPIMDEINSFDFKQLFLEPAENSTGYDIKKALSNRIEIAKKELPSVFEKMPEIFENNYITALYDFNGKKLKGVVPSGFWFVLNNESTVKSNEESTKSLLKLFGLNESTVLKFSEYSKINEAVIKTDDYKDIVLSIFSKRPNIENINQIFSQIGVKVITRDEFIQTLPEGEERENVPPIEPRNPFPFAAYNYHDDIIYIIVHNYHNFLVDINNSADFEDMFKKQFVNHLNNMIQHEMVHREQFKRKNKKEMGNLKNNPSTNKKDYLSDPDEIMAFAKTLVDDLSGRFSKEQLLKMSRDNIPHPLYNDYKRIGGDVFKKFKKYIYMYLDEK